MKVTVIDMKESLKYIQNGEVIKFKKRPVELDDKQIIAEYNGKEIGRIGATVTIIVPGTETNKDIYEKVPDEFQGVVVDNNQTVTTSSTFEVLVVEIKGVGAGQATSTNGTKIFTFSVSGSSTKFPGKQQIAQDVDAGKTVFLQLRNQPDPKSGEDIVVTYRMVNGQEQLCGKIAENELGKGNNSSYEEFQLIKTLVGDGTGKDTIEAKVVHKLATQYVIQIEIPNAMLSSIQQAATQQAISSVKQDLLNKGFDETTLNEVEEYLLMNKFSATEIQNIFKSYKKYDDSVSYRIRKPKTLFTDSFEALKICYAAFLNGYHILCSGDKGTGKNCLISTWAWVLQRPLFSNSVNRETDKLDMLGSKTIDSEVDSTTGKVMDKIIYQPEVMLEAMQCGGIINIDEINFADPGITGLLHSIADDRREIQVPGYQMVSADENFFIMATMNIDYQGTNELNEALADRFIDICFPANKSIAGILNSNCPKSPQSEVQICDNIYKKMYQTVQSRDSSLSSDCLTVRGFIQALNMSAVLGLKKALRVCVADKIKDEEYRNNTWAVIDSLCR